VTVGGRICQGVGRGIRRKKKEERRKNKELEMNDDFEYEY
jgi:hypothetical protein